MYKVYIQDRDFKLYKEQREAKGTRKKLLVKVTENGESYDAFLKYCGTNRLNNAERMSNELVSEKIAYAIARELELNCARIEFAEDSEGNNCILNFSFVPFFEGSTVSHTDIVAFLKDFDSNNRKETYTLKAILQAVEYIEGITIADFIRLQLFDALIGEQDRHEENWGVLSMGDVNLKTMSPFYDNGASLLSLFANDEEMDKQTQGDEVFSKYIEKSRTVLRDQNYCKIPHFQIIEFLLKRYPRETKKEICRLLKLRNDAIKEIVYSVPEQFIKCQQRDKYKEFMIKYIQIRRDKILSLKG